MSEAGPTAAPASASGEVMRSAETVVDPLLGTVLDGRYLVERVVGSGGFGVVYRAVHLQFDSPVAIKVLRISDRAGDEERKSIVEQFLAEGRLLFNLQALHPSIVRVFETGTFRGAGRLAPYLVMEWLDGLSLDCELKYRSEQGMPAPDMAEVIALLAPCVEGLARAHRTRIAHCDIKPGNIFLARRGEQLSSKLLDFGLAKVAADSATTSALLEQTGPGNSSFTPGYGAPEQWLSRLGATGTWTDVYALALVCVELLCGRRALGGADRAQLMAACLDRAQRPTPQALGARVSDEIERVFARALALDPRDRYRRVDDFWQELCSAAQVSSAQQDLEWEPWARARGLDRAAAAGMPVAAQRPVSMAGSAWMQADTAPMAAHSEHSRPRATLRPRRLWLYAVALSACVLVAAMVAARGVALRQAEHRPAALANPTAVRARAPSPAPQRTAATALVARPAPPPALASTPAGTGGGPKAALVLVRQRSADAPPRRLKVRANVAPILRSEPAAPAPAELSPAPASPAPPPVSPEGLLKHDALLRRK